MKRVISNMDGRNLSISVLDIARAQLGVREFTGNNDGPEVEKYLAYVGFKKGNPWCAAWVSWVFYQAGFKQPKTAWSPGLFPAERLVKDASPAMVFGIYFDHLKRIGHCGLVESVRGEMYTTLEGNTNSEGGREGNGVFRRLRHKRTIKALADWLN
ncbi:hypothetical protein ACVWYN_000428 [Pedobacter sp. UYP24]